MKKSIMLLTPLLLILFAGFALGESLLTNDTSDYSTVFRDQNIIFYANYTNNSIPIFNSNISCIISLNNSGAYSSPENMTYNLTSFMYEYQTTINVTGNFGSWMYCNDSTLNFTAMNMSENYIISVDTTAPSITGIGSTTTNESAQIVFSTDKAGNSTVKYGTSNSLGSLSTDSNFVTSRLITLNGLVPETLYYFNVSSCNPDGYCQEKGPYTFTTNATPDTTGPSINFITPREQNDSIYYDWNNVQLSLTTSETSTCYVDSYKVGSSTSTVNVNMDTTNSISHTKYFNATSDSGGFTFFFTVVCTDSNSNPTTETVMFKVNDTIAPTITFTGNTVGNNGKTKSQTVEIGVTMNENPYSGYPRAQLDAKTATQMSYADGVYSYTFTAVTEGDHNITVYGRDLKANEQTLVRSFAVDLSEPEIEINAPEDGEVIKNCNDLAVNVTLDEEGECGYELYREDIDEYDECNDRCSDRYDTCVDRADSTAEKNECKDKKEECEDECEDDKYNEEDSDELELDYGLDDCEEDCEDYFDDCEDTCKDIKDTCKSTAISSSDRDDCEDDYDDCKDDCSDDLEDCKDDCIDTGYIYYADFTRCYRDSEYLLTITCEDIAGNEVKENRTFSIKDTLAPKITYASPNKTVTSNSISLRVNTNEDAICRFSTKNQAFADMEYKFQQTKETHAFQLSNLENGEHTYFILCNDTRGNLMSSAKELTFTVQKSISSEGDPDEDYSFDTVTEKHRFNSIKSGIESNFEISKSEISVEEISVKVREDLEDVEFTIEKMAKQDLVQNPKETAYEFFTISKSGIKQDQIEKITVKFKVEKSWLTANNIDSNSIMLAQYTSNWENINPTKTSEDSLYQYYQADIEEPTMFAIVGEKSKSSGDSSEPDKTPVDNNPQTPNNGDEKEPNEEEPVEVIEDDNGGMSIWIWVILLSFLIVGGGFAAFYLSNKFRHPQQDQAVESDPQSFAAADSAAALSSHIEESPIKESPAEKYPTVNPSDELGNYILAVLKTGMDIPSIKKTLLEAGHDQTTVDAKLVEMNLVKDELKEYIEACLMASQTPEKIKQALLDTGYDEATVNHKLNQMGLYISETSNEPSSELEAYIHQSFLLGNTKEQIKDALMSVGHSEESIEDVLNGYIQETRDDSVTIEDFHSENQELLDYVQDCLSKKLSQRQIKQMLKDSGYTKDEIKTVFKEIKQLKNGSEKSSIMGFFSKIFKRNK